MRLPSFYFRHFPRMRLIRYGVAIVSVIIALLLTLLLQPLIQSTVFSLFFAAVTFSTWYGGLEAGLLATVLSVAASNYFVISVAHIEALGSHANVLHLILFSVVALLVSSLNAELRAARQRAEKNMVELQQSEERYRCIIDTAYEGIWLIGADLKTQYTNQRLTEMLGYSSSELYDRCFYDFMVAETRKEAQEMIARLAIDATVSPVQQDNRQRFDGCFRASDGTLRWAIVSIAPILISRNKFQGMLVMLTDITERKQAEAERAEMLLREQAARAEAEAANRTKDKFLAILSHELRAPLSPILGWAKLLQSQTLDATMTNRAIEVIERNVQLQAQLIEDLLDVSRIVQGKLSLHFCPVNLVSVIESAIETVRLSAIEKAINLRFLTLGDKWDNVAQAPASFSPIHSRHLLSAQKFYVSGDSNRLQQVVWNLLSNAIKFTPKEGQVEIRLAVVDRQDNASPQRFAQIQVIDSGKGIDSEFLPHVFESFRQADSTTTRRSGGLGLGLAIVDHLIKLHGGTVHAESLGEGQGATFTVFLPLLDLENSNPVDSALSSSATLPQASLPLLGARILVVEDDLDTREFLALILEQQGAIVHVVTSAHQALQALQQPEPHLLISDIGMPDIDGYTLIRQIRCHESQTVRNLPAIALTAYVSEADQQESRSAGFQAHLTKPIEPAELVRTIVSMIGYTR